MGAIPPQPECNLEGTRVYIRKLVPGDLGEMISWQRFEDPLLGDYNVPFSDIRSGKDWLLKRCEARWVYGIRNRKGNLIGHLSLRQINLPRSARLGIMLAPAFVGEGYGHDTLSTFLDYFFFVRNFLEMQLDVSEANVRACHLYEKLGFRRVGRFRILPPPGVAAVVRYRTYITRGKMRMHEMRLSAREWKAFRALPW